ncbi:hypothetical protein D9756_010912 [Leucocoprinus leucothites]|uniref:Uncharacterized protein n=1 Tax=Leucocoprinus leucothites TaxID=201217 RepID=A0A8H5FQJ9_9AGAR|nr:hypothetical protein D9756_010912 [Leucoagaricus leucothites]
MESARAPAMYLNHTNQDKTWLRIVDTAQIFLVMVDIFSWYVDNYGDYITFLKFNVSPVDGPLLDSIIMFTVQLVYCWRLWVLGGWKVLPAVAATEQKNSVVSDRVYAMEEVSERKRNPDDNGYGETSRDIDVGNKRSDWYSNSSMVLLNQRTYYNTHNKVNVELSGMLDSTSGGNVRDLSSQNQTAVEVSVIRFEEPPLDQATSLDQRTGTPIIKRENMV